MNRNKNKIYVYNAIYTSYMFITALLYIYTSLHVRIIYNKRIIYIAIEWPNAAKSTSGLCAENCA